MTTMEYQGYVARIDLNKEDDSLHGFVVNISDVVNFEGRNMKELRRNFAKSRKEYFKFCEERGVEPDKPFSGKLLVRVDPAVHSALELQIARERASTNGLRLNTSELAG